MAREKSIRDIMTPISDYPMIYDDATLTEAIKRLKLYQNHVRLCYLLIVYRKKGKYEDDELVGLLTEQDLTESIIKSGAFMGERLTITRAFGIGYGSLFQYNRLFEQRNEFGVSNFMRAFKVFININEHIYKAKKLMISEKSNLILVQDNNKPVGIIKAIDILYLLDTG